MNLSQELAKIAAHSPVACLPRQLSREEISALQTAGEITELANIPEYHYKRRLITPEPGRGASTYGRTLPACKSAY